MTRRALWAAVAGLVLVAGCDSFGGAPTPRGRACEVAPAELIARHLGRDVPTGRREVSDSDHGMTVGCIYDVGGGSIAVWVREAGGRKSYRETEKAMRPLYTLDAIEADGVEGLRIVDPSPNAVGTWLLVGGRTYVQVAVFHDGTATAPNSRDMDQTLTDAVAFDVASTILGKPVPSSPTAG